MPADSPPDRAARISRALELGVPIIAALCLAWPLLGARFLPFVDYPQHLGTIAAIHGASDPRFAPYFVVDYARSQYLTLYVLGDWLSYLFGVEGAGRATAIVSVASLPLALAIFLREHGRPAMLGALAAGVAMHVWVFWGFLNFAAGMSAALLAAAAMARLARAPTAKNAAWLGGAALLTFYTHAQLFAWMGLACVVTLSAMAPAIGRRRALRALGLGGLAALPSALAVVQWLRASSVLTHGEAGGRSGHAAEVAASDGAPVFVPAVDTARQWLAHSFETYADGSGVALAIAFGAALLLLMTLRGRERAVSDARRPSDPIAPLPGPPRTIAPELVCALTFALWLLAPLSYRLIEPINHRFLPLALALLVSFGPRAEARPTLRALIAAALVTLSVFAARTHAARFAETDEEMGDLAAALAPTRAGARVLGLIFDPQSRVVPLPIYLHAHQYYQARVGGLACWSFVELPKSPVVYREGAEPPPFPPRFEWLPQHYDHAVYGEAFDYWLVRHEPGRAPRHVFRGGAPPRAVYEGDRWSLFARDAAD